MVSGIIIKNEMPVSFDSKERKKAIAPRISGVLAFDVLYFSKYQIEIRAKRKQRISSRLLILFTTSV